MTTAVASMDSPGQHVSANSPDSTGPEVPKQFQVRPLLRADIEWSRREVRQSTRWLARDPISLRFYWFGDREYRLMRLFTGHRTLAEIQSVWQQRHELDPLGDRELREFVLRLESQGVVHFAGVVSARRVEQRFERNRRRRWLSLASSPLAIRVPLFDPTPLLKRCDWIRTVLFHPVFLAVSMALVILIGVLTTAVMSTQWLNQNLLEQLLVGDGVWFLLIGFVVLKSMHELGHALACRHFGGECHEIGVLFLVLVPCLYCDVSDAWKLKSSAARMMISAAGILVELLFAAFAAVVWMSTQPSPINSVAFSMMLVGSLGSVFVNGNPLLRYDGYYILSDFVGIPNLAQQSQESLHSMFRRFFFRNQFESTHWDASATWLRVYGVAAFVYRMLLLVVIFLALHHWLNPFGLQWLLMPLFAGVLLASYFRLRHVSQFIQREFADMRRLVFGGAIAVFGCAAYVFFFVPLPSRVQCRGVVLRSPREAVYAPVDAILSEPLIETITGSEPFAPGDTLVQLESWELQLQRLAMVGEVEAYRQSIEDLASRQVDDPDAASQLATARQSLMKLEPQVEDLDERLQELTVVAPRAGIVLAGDRVPMSLLSTRPVEGHAEVPKTGQGLKRDFQGAVFERGTQLAMIASADQWDAEVLIDEPSLRWVQVGATARIRLDRFMNRIVEGTVEEISVRPISKTPEQLQLDSSFQSVAGTDGIMQPANPHYSVTIRIESADTGSAGTFLEREVDAGGKSIPGHGAVLTASIDTPPQILAIRCYEFVLRLLREN